MRPILVSIFAVAFTLAGQTGLQAEPALPSGLSTKPENSPSLPAGLGTPQDQKSESGPSLPSGLGGTSTTKEQIVKQPEGNGFFSDMSISGFVEVRAGLRLQPDATEKAASLAEGRLQASFEKSFDLGTATLTADALYDPIPDQNSLNLESGTGFIDLREANFLMRPTDFTDLKLGRQVLTWGTGDLLFINDLFPKDWNSFFIGRDEEYLKAPSDAIKLSAFNNMANLDVIYTPRFDADRYINGDRLSYYSPMLGSIVGRNAMINTEKPDNWFVDDELALRLYRNIGSAEVALYFYDGYWKSPAGQNALTGLATFPRLRVYGASYRKPALGGIISGEIGYYDSRDDTTGADPFVNNSEMRFLAGFEKELGTNLTGNFQYYVERIEDYQAYQTGLPAGSPARDKMRHVFTLRLTKLAMSQTLIWSFFTYYSPSDKDGYLRPKMSYKITDNWLTEAGGNIFFGADDHSFFGQFRHNNNAFLALRRSF